MYKLIDHGSFYSIPRYALVIEKSALKNGNSIDSILEKLPLNALHDSYNNVRQRKLTASQSEKNKRGRLTIFPVGVLCEGSCTYCYTKWSPETHRQLKNKDNFMTPEGMEPFLKQVEPHIVKDDLNVFLMGGDPLLHPHIDELVDKIYDVVGCKFKLAMCADFMWSDKRYAELTEQTYKWLNDDRIKSVQHICTIDFGSPERFSAYHNLTPKDIQNRYLEWLDLFQDNDKAILKGKSVLSNRTNIHELLDIYKSIEDKNHFMEVDTCYNVKHIPTLSQTKEYIEAMEKEYKVVSMHRERKKLLVNDYTRRQIENKNRRFYNMWVQLMDGVYYFDPRVNQICAAYCDNFAFNATNFVACVAGFLEETPDIDSVMQLSPNSSNNDNIYNLANHCKDCEYQPTCEMCNLLRKYVKCNEHEGLKYWFEWSWRLLCENRDTWRVQDIDGNDII